MFEPHHALDSSPRCKLRFPDILCQYFGTTSAAYHFCLAQSTGFSRLARLHKSHTAPLFTSAIQKRLKMHLLHQVLKLFAARRLLFNLRLAVTSIASCVLMI